MLSADVKNNKEKPVQPFILDSSSMTLKKDYKHNKKSESHTTDIKFR